MAAAEAAERLRGTIGIDGRIVSSPLRRALETAEAIAARTGAPIDLDARWQEADVGAVEGLTFLDIAARWPSLARRLADGDTAIDWPDGETAVDFERAGRGGLVAPSPTTSDRRWSSPMPGRCASRCPSPRTVPRQTCGSRSRRRSCGCRGRAPDRSRAARQPALLGR